MLAQLRNGADPRQYWPELQGWSDAGEVARLEELGHALVGMLTDRRWTYDMVLDQVEVHLALTPSADRAAAAARIALGGAPLSMVRRMAAFLAQGQREDVLVSLLAGLPAGEPATELGACLLHEMILRGKSVTPVADAWSRRLAGHPLGGLALYPLPGETRVPPRADPPFGPAKVDPITSAGTVPAVTREATPPDLTAAVTTWLTESNGKAEAAVFTLAPPLSLDEVGVRTLDALGLDCLAGGGLALRRADLDEVVTMLFGAAANGGAYDHGLGGAYGRAAAWRSLNALAGGSHAGRTWWIFDAANDWFHRVMWDLGVVCLHPGGHVMAVLAATDTD